MIPQQELPDERKSLSSQTLQAPLRWPLVNTLGSRNSNFNYDARLINAYAERSQEGWEIEKRPGFAVTPVIAGTGIGQGLFNALYYFSGKVSPLTQPASYNYILSVENNNLYFLAYKNGLVFTTKTFIAPVLINYGAATPTRAQFLAIAGTRNILLGGGSTTWTFGTNYLGNPNQATGPYAYIVNISTALAVPTGGMQVQILTPDLPLGSSAIGGYGGYNYYGYPESTVPGFVILDGFIYVMDISGTIWQTTSQNDPTVWNSGASITAASDADFGVQLARQFVYVVAIKTWTTQFFYDAGNPTGSSLSPLPGVMYNFGCLSADTFADLDGVLFWVTQSKVGTYRIVMVESLKPNFISTPAVERQLDLGPGSTWYSLAYQHAGHRWYVITNLTSNVTMVYDIDEKLWYLWTDFNGNYYPVVSRCSSFAGKEWHQMGATGNTYQLDADYVYPNDYGNIVPVDIYTPNFDAGVDRQKYLSQMRYNADQTDGSTLYVRNSDDDYQTWTNFRRVDLSQIRPIMNDCGTFYRRAYHIRHKANTALRIRSIDLQMDLGTL
jgi:hypothetical protein